MQGTIFRMTQVSFSLVSPQIRRHSATCYPRGGNILALTLWPTIHRAEQKTCPINEGHHRTTMTDGPTREILLVMTYMIPISSAPHMLFYQSFNFYKVSLDNFQCYPLNPIESSEGSIFSPLFILCFIFRPFGLSIHFVTGFKQPTQVPLCHLLSSCVGLADCHLQSQGLLAFKSGCNAFWDMLGLNKLQFATKKKINF